MTNQLRKRDRFLFGMVLPSGILVLGLFIVMAMPSSAGAAEFASLGIMLVAITASPVILGITAALAWTATGTKLDCFKRCMILPLIVLLIALAYQIGIIDAFQE